MEASASSGGFFYILSAVTLAGGFGGFVSALTKVDREGRPPKYTLPCPLRPLHQKDISFVGDVLIGAAAAISLFFGIDTIFGVKLNSAGPIPASDYLRLISLGVISGYAGAGMLISISQMLLQRATKAQQKTVEEEKKVLTEQAEVERLKRQMLNVKLFRMASKFRERGAYEDAIRKCDEILTTDPRNVDALITKGTIYAQKAEAENNPELYDMAIALTTQVLDIDKSSSRAYYNRACYQVKVALLRKVTLDKDKFLEDLAHAFELDPSSELLAQHDPDFKTIRDESWFKDLQLKFAAKASAPLK